MTRAGDCELERRGWGRALSRARTNLQNRGRGDLLDLDKARSLRLLDRTFDAPTAHSQHSSPSGRHPLSLALLPPLLLNSMAKHGANSRAGAVVCTHIPCTSSHAPSAPPPLFVPVVADRCALRQLFLSPCIPSSLSLSCAHTNMQHNPIKALNVAKTVTTLDQQLDNPVFDHF